MGTPSKSNGVQNDTKDPPSGAETPKIEITVCSEDVLPKQPCARDAGAAVAAAAAAAAVAVAVAVDAASAAAAACFPTFYTKQKLFTSSYPQLMEIIEVKVWKGLYWREELSGDIEAGGYRST